MPDTAHSKDDVVIGEWTPKFTVFLVKLLFLALVTAMIFSVPTFVAPSETGFGFWLVSVVLGALVYLIVFDDHTDWFRHSSDHWKLTPSKLCYQSKWDSASIEISDITSVRAFTFWSIRIRLKNGKSFVMKFLRDKRKIIQAIEKTRQNLDLPATEGASL